MRIRLAWYAAVVPMGARWATIIGLHAAVLIV